MYFNLNIVDNRVLTILILRIIKHLFIYFFKQEYKFNQFINQLRIYFYIHLIYIYINK